MYVCIIRNLTVLSDHWHLAKRYRVLDRDEYTSFYEQNLMRGAFRLYRRVLLRG
jgi:hypothetical protein